MTLRLALCFAAALVAASCARNAQPETEIPVRVPAGITPLTVEQDREIAG